MMVRIVFASIVALLAGGGAAGSAPVERATTPQADSAYTPARGSAERTAILDAMRAGTSSGLVR